MIEARFAGWGTAFESRTKAIQIVVDVRFDPDEIARSVLRQSSATINTHIRQKARAAVLGFERPLDAETFADLERLHIDIACAQALRVQFGSDVAVREWLRAELRRAGSRVHNRATTTSGLQVHGLNVAVPFLLSPVELTCLSAPETDRPRWLDNEVRIVADGGCRADEIPSVLDDVLRGTHMAGRPVVEVGPWPPIPVRDALLGWRNQARRLHGLSEDVLPIQAEWRVLLEHRRIKVVSAFG
ncbi:hypothetical protein QP178_05435 [Sphingomonas aurantiaca]|uniref:hypothetical protein n=1 Tax=Sphingomonas aurantiaca TaxID=185949 RepID=UPI002FDF4D79